MIFYTGISIKNIFALQSRSCKIASESVFNNQAQIYKMCHSGLRTGIQD